LHPEYGVAEGSGGGDIQSERDGVASPMLGRILTPDLHWTVKCSRAPYLAGRRAMDCYLCA
jgi:hypothetical protein